MIGVLLRWVTGGGLRGIAGQLRGAYEAKLNAQTDSEKLKADVTIAQLEARQNVLMNSGKITGFVQALWAAPFIAYNGKIIIYDKMMGLGVTDPLGPFETQLGLLIAGFYFLTTGVRAILR